MISGSSSARQRAFDESEANAWARALARDLIAPPLAVDIHELANIWSYERVRVICRRPHDFADYPELSVRVRGAFGRALAAVPASCQGGWSRPSPFSILFSPAGKWTSGLEMPKPFVLRARVEHDRLIADLSLFGAASVFADEAAASLEACLRKGIAIGPDSSMRVPLTVIDVTHTRCEGVSYPSVVRAASLFFRTPVAVRAGGSLKSDPHALLSAVLTRVSGLARWQGVSLRLAQPGQRTLINTLAIDDREMIPARWKRFSIRRGANAIPMEGWLGPLRVGGRLDGLAAFLALAETCNVGSHASLGLGWFDLSMA